MKLHETQSTYEEAYEEALVLEPYEITRDSIQEFPDAFGDVVLEPYEITRDSILK